jgi:peptidoglycan hydrolase CwlO-like protein
MNDKQFVIIWLIVFIIFLILFTPFDLNADEVDLLNELEQVTNDYEDLLNEHEKLLNDYEDLNNKYEELLIKYNNTKKTFELAKEQINNDNIEITQIRNDLERMTKLVDPKYFTVFILGGVLSSYQSVDLGFEVDVPHFPISFYLSGGYVFNQYNNFSFKAGLGFQF